MFSPANKLTDNLLEIAISPVFNNNSRPKYWTIGFFYFLYDH